MSDYGLKCPKCGKVHDGDCEPYDPYPDDDPIFGTELPPLPDIMRALIEQGLGSADCLERLKGFGYDPPGDVFIAEYGKLARLEQPSMKAISPVERLVLNRAAPMDSAHEFVRRECTHNGIDILQYWRKTFYMWNGSLYFPVDDDMIRSKVWKFLESACTLKVDKNGNKTYPAFDPKPNDVNGLIDALKAVAGINAQIGYTWLTSTTPPSEGKEYIAFKNGLYHLQSSTLLPCNAYFFNTGATDIAFNAKATQPVEWFKFLKAVWPSDQQSIDALQEMMGYLLTSDTSMQKIFMLNGPPRAGKGTIFKMIELLVSVSNFVALTLDMLAEPFGMEHLLDKTVALIGDAKVSKHTNSGVVGERLKGVSGEDTVPIQRKYKGALTARLLCRFVIASNGLLGISDPSGVLVTRIIMLQFTQSFLGREDPTLFEKKLKPEAAGIMNWALEGLKRLMARGKFVQPDSSIDSIETIKLLGSPEIDFVEECCELGGAFEVRKDALYAAWVNWCSRNNWKAGTKEFFSRNLFSAYAGQIAKVRPKDTEASKAEGKLVQYNAYRGLRLIGSHTTASVPSEPPKGGFILIPGGKGIG